MCNGKEKEMNALILVATAAKKYPVEPLRHTTTNTPDSGMDICMVATKKFFQEFISIAKGELSEFSNPQNDNTKKIEVRIDAKERSSNKITKPEAEKFIDDMVKHPRKDGHILLGGTLTKGAASTIEEAQQSYGDKKTIVHISDDEMKNLENVILPKLNKDETT